MFFYVNTALNKLTELSNTYSNLGKSYICHHLCKLIHDVSRVQIHSRYNEIKLEHENKKKTPAYPKKMLETKTIDNKQHSFAFK